MPKEIGYAVALLGVREGEAQVEFPHELDQERVLVCGVAFTWKQFGEVVNMKFSFPVSELSSVEDLVDAFRHPLRPKNTGLPQS